MRVMQPPPPFFIDQVSTPPPPPLWTGGGFTKNARMGIPCTQCKVLYVGNYPNPSFSPFAEVCCSIIGGFRLLVHSGYSVFKLLSIFTYFHLFVPIFTHSPFG